MTVCGDVAAAISSAVGLARTSSMAAAATTGSRAMVASTVCWGGSGHDSFDFYSSGDSGVGAGHRDIIEDFVDGQDTIVLTELFGFPFASSPGQFIGKAAFTHEDQVRFKLSGDDTIVQVNLDADAKPEMEIELTGHHSLVANSFWL